MNLKTIRVTWANGTHSYYNSIKSCSENLGITQQSVINYLSGKKIPKFHITFEYYSMTSEENLLREVTNINRVNI